MPPAVAAAGIGAIGSIGAAAMQGDGTQVTSVELPPEFEYGLIERFGKDLNDIDDAKKRMTSAIDTYNKSLDILDQGMKNQIPSDEVQKRLATGSADLAISLGLSIEEAVANGLIPEEDRRLFEQQQQDLDYYREQTRTLESADYEDVVLKNQLEDERAKLQQDLRRSGMSPAAIAQRMNQFDREAEASMFSRTEELRTSKLGRLSSAFGNTFGAAGDLVSGRQSARESTFGLGERALGAQQSELERITNAYGALGASAQARFGAGVSAEEAQQRLRTEGFGRYLDLGKFGFSGRTQDALRQGEFGPLSDGSGNGPAALANPDVRGVSEYVVNKYAGEYSGSDLGRLEREREMLFNQSQNPVTFSKINQDKLKSLDALIAQRKK